MNVLTLARKHTAMGERVVQWLVILAMGCNVQMVFPIHASSHRFCWGSPVSSCLQNWDVLGSIKLNPMKFSTVYTITQAFLC